MSTGDHIIFKVCISCGYDTLQYPDLLIERRPSYVCPGCKAYSFVIACSECLFECLVECPLTQLLGQKLGSLKGTTVAENQTLPKDHERLDQAPKKAKKDNLADRDACCPDCRQQRCHTCDPGYMSLVVDMKEFSKTFAEEMKLCTLCEHWLCPGSALVVMLRCRECSHEQCQGCRKIVDEAEEEWYVCCFCEKGLKKDADLDLNNSVEGENPRKACPVDEERIAEDPMRKTVIGGDAAESCAAKRDEKLDGEQNDEESILGFPE